MSHLYSNLLSLIIQMKNLGTGRVNEMPMICIYLESGKGRIPIQIHIQNQALCAVSDLDGGGTSGGLIPRLGSRFGWRDM